MRIRFLSPTPISCKYRRAIATIALLLSPFAHSSDVEGYAVIAPLFADDSVLDVMIEAPLTTLMKERPDEEYLEGSFSYTEADGNQQTFSLKLRTRGNYRRDPEHCRFAPIRLNFGVSEVAGTLFEGQDKLKLVTHCLTGRMRAEQLVVREYIAYRLLHELTSVSYNVRMFRIRYVDTEGARDLTRLAFVIEDDAAVADRNGLELIDVRSISPEELDPRQQNLLHIFEYMIGNTEYSLVNPEPKKSCCHNVDMLSASGGPLYLPLPYDFDFAGLVNAPYAEPNPRYPLRTVRTRYYKGVCGNNELLPDTLRSFRVARDSFERVIEDAEFLSASTRKSIRAYLEKFFDRISDQESVDKYLIGNCRIRENVYD